MLRSDLDNFDLIELCAGTAAVSLLALGAPVFPASRIGSKAGYAEICLNTLGISPGSAKRVLLVEADPRIARILQTLFSANCAWLAEELALVKDVEPKALWLKAKDRHDAVGDLLWLAGARGGIGGFKGLHKLRPNVDGFIPSRSSLVERVRNFIPFEGRAVVLNSTIESVVPPTKRTNVYIDPPYVGRQGYGFSLEKPIEDTAAYWASCGHKVLVSEARPLTGATATFEITEKRVKQSRRSLTQNAVEWLSLYDNAGL